VAQTSGSGRAEGRSQRIGRGGRRRVRCVHRPAALFRAAAGGRGSSPVEPDVFGPARLDGATADAGAVRGDGGHGGLPELCPEVHLARWFREQGEDVPIYCFVQTGVRPLLEGYRTLVERLGVDTVILVDGGTDSLM